MAETVENKIIVIEPTNSCNSSCKLCPHSEYRRRWGKTGEGFMRFSTFNRILRQSRGWRNVYVLGWRGEPTVNKNFPEMLRKLVQVKHQESRVVVETSGIFPYRRGDVGEIYRSLTLADRVVFGLHNRLSLNAYKTYIRDYYDESSGQEVWLSRVKGMDPEYDVLPPAHGARRVVDDFRPLLRKGGRGRQPRCPWLGRMVAIAFDGSVSHCYWVWDTEPMYNVNLMDLSEIFSRYIERLAESYGEAEHPCYGCRLQSYPVVWDWGD